jgi:hypothetical protein
MGEGRTTATDPDLFEATYPAWLAMAEEIFQELVRGGLFPAEVWIDAAEFAQ